MIREFASVLIALVFFTTVAQAQAQETKLGTTSLKLTAPIGFCAITESHEIDKRIVAALRESMRPGHLLGQYADCRQLADWRSGKRGTLDDVYHYGARPTMAQAETRATEKDVKNFCDYVRAEGAKAFQGVISDAKARAEKALEGLKINESRIIGVVKEEPGACYWAALQKIQADTGAQKTNVSVSVITLAKEKLITGVVTSPYVDAESVTKALARQTSNVTALRAAN